MILQKARYATVKAQVCTEVRMVNTMYCGNYDHQTRLPHLSFPQLKPVITPDTCMHRHAKKKWSWHQPGNDRVFTSDLRLGEAMVKHEHTVGSTDMDGSHANCWGGTLVYNPEPSTAFRYHEPMKDVVQDVQWVVSISEVELRIDLVNGTVYYPAEGRILNEFPQGESIQPGETILWTPPQRSDVDCPYFTVRQDSKAAQGQLITSGDGDLWFQGDGDSHVRLKLKKPSFRACGAQIYETNYELLYFAPGNMEDHPHFSRPLPLYEISMSTFVNQQDAYIYDVLSNKIQMSARAQMEFVCSKDEAERQTKLARITAERSAALDGETVRIDEEGWFITRAGDGWHRYRCRRILVQAVETPQCYSSLPVILNASDYDTYRKINYMGPPEKNAAVHFNLSGATIPTGTSSPDRGEGNLGENAAPATAGAQVPEQEPLKFFVTPVSHRLTTVGVPRYCARLFPALYQNAQGNWLAVGPQLRLYINREVRTVAANLSMPEVNAVPDFNAEGGGLYSASDLRTQEEMVLTPRWIQDVTHKLAQSAMMSRHREEFNDDPTADTLLRNLPTNAWSWLGTAWDTIYKVVSVMAFLSGLWVLWNLVKGCLGLSLRCCAVLRNYGPLTPALLPAIAPGLWNWQGSFNHWIRRNKYFNPEGNNPATTEAQEEPVVEEEAHRLGARPRPIIKAPTVPSSIGTFRRHRRHLHLHLPPDGFRSRRGSREEPTFEVGAWRNEDPAEREEEPKATKYSPPPHYPDLQSTTRPPTDDEDPADPADLRLPSLQPLILKK